MELDIVIQNGMIADGSGNPWFKADFGIKDGKIVEISRTKLEGNGKTINAEGLVVSPGFIDLHTHSDRSVVMHNRCENYLRMGVTTMGGGQCGSSIFPITERILERMPEEMASEVDWTTLAGWRKHMEAKGVGANLAPYVGFGSLRRCVMGVEGEGGERYEPTEAEMGEMKSHLDQAMREGAFGLSTGLRYSEQRNAFTEEVIELARVVAKYGGMYISHMRSESDRLIEACKELIEICEKANIRGCYSHHKAMFPENWGKPSETMRLLDEARARGLEIYCDQYPWEYARETNLGTWFRGQLDPEEKKTEPVTLEELVDAMRDPERWEMIKQGAVRAYDEEVEKNEERKRALGERRVAVSAIWNPETFDYVVYSKTRSDLVGKNLRGVAEAMGLEDFWEAARELYIADEGLIYVAAGGMREADMITILKYPTTSVSTDASALDLSKIPFSEMSQRLSPGHPRGWGTFPKVLQRYVREMGVLRLEDAVRKMTSLPAQFLDVKDRGAVRKGCWADITIFDLERIENRATYAEPTLYPLGIHYVIVNGQVVIEKGEHTGSLPGKILFHGV